MAISIKDRITNALLKRSLISQENLDKAIRIQKENGGKLSEVLVEAGFVKRESLMAFLSQELGIPTISLARYRIDTDILKLIPKKIALHYKILPISKMGDVLTIAMADPLNILAIDDITALTGYKIGPVVTTDKDMEEAINQYFGEDTHRAVEKIIEDIEEAKGIEMVTDTMKEDLDSATLMRLTQEAPVVKVTNMLLNEGVRLRASDILVEPLEREMRVRYRVDGILQEGKSPPRNMHAAIISRLKVMSNLNIAERRLPQDGRFKIRLHDREIDFRISVLPSSFGEKAAVRVLDKNIAMLELDKLGFEEDQLEYLREAAARPHGMLLVCGPTGCGKTTTLYSILKFIDSPEKNIVTVEDPVEYDLKGINQVTIRPDIGLTFASSLRAILRQDPDIIMVGEIRDYDTADTAIKAALTGHLVLSTLHTTTASGSVARLINMGIEPFLISSSVILVAAQRLVRRICPKCKEEEKPGLYKGAGCDICARTGYKGRAGLIECLRLSPAIKDLISSRARESQIKERARKEGMKTLRENGLVKVKAGITTLEEIFRVTAGDEDV